MADRYLFVGGPLDGRVQEHDGRPLIVEPNPAFKFETPNFFADVSTIKVAYAGSFYHSVRATVGDYRLNVMTSNPVEPSEAAVLRAMAKALNVTLYTGSEADRDDH